MDDAGEGTVCKEAPSVLPIDRRTIHQICSGQVVLNLATAMKELLENSLDAGATSVDIKLKENGAELVEVSDDGHGVEPHNFEALTLKHHTSKLRDFSDLTAVETFGFRGEALSSLCALSNLTITTRHKSQMAGTKLEYDHNGRIKSKTPCARQQGTTVNLINLFSTLPVRHKEFLRNVKKEFVKLVHVLNGYCLISSGVRITCSNQVGKGKKTTVVSTTGGEQIRDNITCVFGAKQVQSLIPFQQINPLEEECNEYNIKDSHSNLYQITGYISKADHGLGRSSADRQFFYINKRPCDLIKVSRVVNEVYHMFNRHQYPFVMLDISLQRDAVDVNVTPDKRQVFMQDEKLLLAIIKSSLKSMFDTGTTAYEVNQKPLAQLNLTVPGNQEQNTDNDVKDKSLEKTTSAGNHSDKVFPSLNSFKRPFSLISSESDLTREPKQAKLTNFCKGNSVSIFEKSNELEQCNDEKSESFGIEVCQKNPDPIEICEGGSKKDSNAAVIFVDEVHMAKQKEEDPVLYEKECEGDKTCEEINSNTKVVDFSLEVPIRKKNSKIVESNNTEISNSQEKLPVVFKNRIKRPDLKDIVRTRKTMRIDFNIAKFKESKETKKKEQNLETAARLFRAKISPENNAAAEEELTKNINRESFAKMEILGQFNLGFILTKLGDDIFIIDQHASDEKYNFEYQQKHSSLKTQRLILPKKLELTAASESVLLDNIEIFQKNGFEFEIDESAESTKKVKLISVPVSKNWTFGVEDVEELLFMLSDSPGVMCRPTRVRKMFASRACRMSFMVGTALSREQMKMIVNHMGEMDHPWNCPHGRPTMRHVINLNMIPSVMND